MQSIAASALKYETVAMTVTDRRDGSAPATLRCAIDGKGHCGGGAFTECAMDEQAFILRPHWTGLAPSVPSLCG